MRSGRGRLSSLEARCGVAGAGIPSVGGRKDRGHALERMFQRSATLRWADVRLGLEEAALPYVPGVDSHAAAWVSPELEPA